MDILRGTGVALVTPFDAQNNVDYDALLRIIKHTDSGGVDYFVAMGTTGESSTLSWDEKLQVISFIQEHIEKPLIVGHGGNNTKQLVDDLNLLKSFNIQAILSVVPYYSKPSQLGLQKHFEAIAEASKWPLILYNVPARTSCNLEADTVLKLAQHENIIAIKEASGDLVQIRRIIEGAPEQFNILSGDDARTLEIIRSGGSGVISVIANYKPLEFSQMVKLALSGDFEGASQLDERLINDYLLMTAEGNPVSVKTALSCLGLCEDHVRLPLVPGSDQLRKKFA